jgi:hypothetical protein
MSTESRTFRSNREYQVARETFLLDLSELYGLPVGRIFDTTMGMQDHRTGQLLATSASYRSYLALNDPEMQLPQIEEALA